MIFPLSDLNPHHRWPVITIGLIVINTLVMFRVANMTPDEQRVTYLQRGFIPARAPELWGGGQPLVIEQTQPAQVDWRRRVLVPARTLRVEITPEPREVWISLVTMMFLHGGWAHLLGNMWFLWLFGNNIEDRMGPLLFLLFYLVGGLAAAAVHYLTDMQSLVPVVGASGAVSAVLGAYLVWYPQAMVRCLLFLFVFVTLVDLPAIFFLGGWFVMQLYSAASASAGVNEQAVAFWAHVGGFVAGAAIALAVGKANPARAKRESAMSARLSDVGW